MSLVNIINLPLLGDERGSLVALEADKIIPFKIQRVYYIFDTKADVSRGFHAHKELKQVAICLSGKCCMLLDDGKEKKKVWLDSPTKGLVIKSMVWREMSHFSQDCVLLVIASEKYQEEDYIRDYESFKQLVGKS